ncbi:hypothetical protein [Erythrobacter sp. AP23]|uniref:hypothetical protein n=1 Tax=Erythrobacter sp. AP23 TaxID=499656 RepID=UPI00076C7151|nr:hypothetical protein [Erythrobacter sp. AP23]KWV94938.1 hypothetical protein ASS64_07030 [Erythrobacter sp. AP23]
MTNNLYIRERTIAMSARKQALFWAGAMLAIAVLAVLDVVPQEVAQFSVLVLPVLAWLGIMPRSGCCAFLQKGSA